MIFQPPVLNQQELQVIAQIDEIRATLRYALQASMHWTGFLRRNTVARAIQGSNSIEGYAVDADDAVAAVEGEEPVKASGDTWKAVTGYQHALSYVMQLADDPHFTLNEELIRSLHYMLQSYDTLKNPGRWRPGPIFVRRDPSGELMYEGPPAERVPELMRELVAVAREPGDEPHSLIRAAMAHLNLVMIHPFSDGNGRMGRVVQTLVLARGGISSPTFSSIEEYLGARGNTEDYYQVLADTGGGTWQPERDARAWVRFCLVAHFRQATSLSRRMRETARLWDALEAELTRRALDQRMIFALADAAIGLRVGSARYRSSAEASMQVAGRDLGVLVKQGLLAAVGEKRGRTYVAGALLKEIWFRTREPRAPVLDPFASQQLMLNPLTETKEP